MISFKCARLERLSGFAFLLRRRVFPGSACVTWSSASPLLLPFMLDTNEATFLGVGWRTASALPAPSAFLP